VTFANLRARCRAAGGQGESTLDWQALGNAQLLSLNAPNARFVRKSKFRSDQNAMFYIVAVADADQAVQIIRSKIADLTDDVEDLGRVSQALVRALKLTAGEFTRIGSNYNVSP
jgi:hypothetical protein